MDKPQIGRGSLHRDVFDYSIFDERHLTVVVCSVDLCLQVSLSTHGGKLSSTICHYREIRENACFP